MSEINPRQPIDACLAEAIARYTDDNPLSLAQHRRASQSMPGGNTRSVLYSDPFPITLVRGRGAYVTSLDESEYVDYLGDYTAGLYGHSDPTIAAAIWEASQSGWVPGGHSTVEEQFAALLRKRFKPLQHLRFTNSGTEANLMAITAALEYTERTAIVVFEGGYHGSVLNFCAARVRNLPFEFIVLPYGAGSMMHIHMRRGPIADYRDASGADAKLRALFHYDLLESGIWSAHGGMFCLSLPMGDSERRQLVRALDDFIIERCELFNDIPD